MNPSEVIGEAAQAKLGAYAAEHGLLRRGGPLRQGGRSGRQGAERRREFAFTLDQLRAMANDLTPREMIDAIVARDGLG